MTLPISCPVKPFLVRITVSLYLVECSMMFLAGPTFLTCINLWPQVQEKWMLALVPHGFCLKRKVSTSLTITISEENYQHTYSTWLHMTALPKKRTRNKNKYFASSYVSYRKPENIGQTVLPYWFLELAHMALPLLTAIWQSLPQ